MEILQRLKQRKLVQWSLAYVAFGFALIQGVDVVAQQFGWPEAVRRGITLALVLGFFVVLVLAWYHGERGAQHVTGTELLIITLLLAVGGGVLWRYARAPVVAAAGSSTGVAAANSMAPVSRALGTTSAAMAASPTATQSIPAKSIAVLPFENLSSDKDNAYFSDGMQDLILTKLADIGQLKVISRTSTMKYASHPDDLKTIAQQLGVATILEGSVQKSGNQVLINVQLIDAKTDAHLWAQSYTRTLDNVFGVEGEVAGQIATALNAKLSPTETARIATSLSANNAANDLFLRAEYLTHRGDINYDTASWKSAIPLYRQAIQLDQDFALALARVSYSESVLVWFGGGGKDVRQLTAQARTDAERALKLAPDLPASQLAMGYSDYYGRGDYAGALKSFAAVLALRPNDADALAATAYVERRQGRFDAAIASLQHAITQDPRNSRLAFVLGDVYSDVSRYADAEAWYERALALDPNNGSAKSFNSQAILFSSGDIPRALAAVQGDDPALELQRVGLLTYQRNYQQALTLLASIPDTPDNFSPSDGPKVKWMADLYRLAGDTARARTLYARALPRLHTQLKVQQGFRLAFVWQNIAATELGLGQVAQALNAIDEAHGISARNADQVYGPAIMLGNAALYAEAGYPDRAVPLLADALATPGIGRSYSPVMLWIDPVWDPIRHDPRFQVLLKKYAVDAPAAAGSEVKP